MNEKRDRLLIEKLLGYEYLGSGINEVTYREPLTAARCTVDMANFFFLLWNRAQEKEWWNDFLRRYEPWNWEILISPGGLADALAEFLEDRQ